MPIFYFNSINYQIFAYILKILEGEIYGKEIENYWLFGESKIW